MAWNQGGSSAGCGVQGAKGGTRHKAPGTKRNGLIKGVVAGLVVVIGAVGAFVYLTSGGDEAKASSTVEKKPAKIAEGKVVEQHLELPEEVKPVKKDAPKPKPFWEQDNTNGFNSAMLRKWKAMRRPKAAYTNDMARNIPKLKCEIFKTPVENEIATFMTLKPGTSVIGMPRYDEAYEKEFLKSCEEPIIIDKDDDEYTRQLKEDMRAMKIELMDRVRNGEKIGDIMRETRIEAQKLAAMKEDVLVALRAAAQEPGATEADEEINYEAANKILAEYGIDPVKPRSLNRYQLKRMMENK